LPTEPGFNQTTNPKGSMDSFTSLGDMVRPVQPCSQDAHNTSVGAGFAATDWGQKGWRNQLHHLEPLDLPLLAVGAGTERKACCDPAATPTWQIHRNTDESRLKVAFRLTEQQQQQLGQIKTKVETKPPIEDDTGKVIAKGEAVELFHQGGSQVIVLGQHHKSKGHYFWPDAMGPENLAPVPECWWQAALTIAGDTTKTTTTKAKSTGKGDWRSLNPCPICGRYTTSYCSQHKDGKTIRCFHGSTFKPPMGLKAGDEITDKQGTIWAFSKVQGNGDVFSVFVAPDPDRRRRTAKTVNSRSKPTITSTGIQAVLDARGSGWRPQKEGPPIRSKMAIGDFSGRLTSELGNRLGFDEVALMPAVDRVPLKDWEVSLLHGELSEAGWIIGSEAAEAGLLLAARRNPFHPVREYLKRVEGAGVTHGRQGRRQDQEHAHHHHRPGAGAIRQGAGAYEAAFRLLRNRQQKGVPAR
jgi:hypothetical protein